MKICHVISMDHIDQEGLYTKNIFNHCVGKHDWCTIYDKPKKSDIYILHCVKNELKFPLFINWQKPKGSKVISVVHSSEPCMPAKCSDVVVTITKAWQKRLFNLYGIKSTMIYPGIDKRVETCDYKSKIFGKISRPEYGKYHKDWNKIVKEILKENWLYKCRIFSNGYKKLDYLKHRRMQWVEGVSGDDKFNELSKLGLYVEAHRDDGNAFIDTFCVSVLEAMSIGLPIVVLKGLQDPIIEVLGSSGVVVDNMTDWKDTIKHLMYNPTSRKVIGERCRKRSKFFGKTKQIREWNSLLRSLK